MDSGANCGEVLIPPRYADVKGTLIFLAGPIMRAWNWQDTATRLLLRSNPELHIANPRRPIFTDDDFQEAMFIEQLDWEHHYLKRAGQNGVVMFWLAKEGTHRCDRAYAQTTRFELGEASAKHFSEGIKVVVGVEEGFTGSQYIIRTLTKKYPKIPVIIDDLAQTCAAALRCATS